jgi:hypothetical protein
VAAEAAAHWRQVVRDAMPQTGEDLARTACTVVVRVAETWAVLKGLSEAWSFALRRGRKALGRSAPASEAEAASQNITISIAINGAPAQQAAATEILAQTRNALLDEMPRVNPAQANQAAQAIEDALAEALGSRASAPRLAGLDRPILISPRATPAQHLPEGLEPPRPRMTLVDGGWLIETPVRGEREKSLACDLARLAARPSTSAVLWVAPDGALGIRPPEAGNTADPAPLPPPASPSGDHPSSPTLN